MKVHQQKMKNRKLYKGFVNKIHLPTRNQEEFSMIIMMVKQKVLKQEDLSILKLKETQKVAKIIPENKENQCINSLILMIAIITQAKRGINLHQRLLKIPEKEELHQLHKLHKINMDTFNPSEIIRIRKSSLRINQPQTLQIYHHYQLSIRVLVQVSDKRMKVCINK